MLPVVPKSVHPFKSKFLPKGPFEYVPFTIGQESVLLAVKGSKDEDEKNNAIRQVVRECIATPNYDVDSIPLFLLELVFLRLREKALGEIMEFSYICKHQTAEATETEEAKQCNTPIDVRIDLRKIDIKEYDGHSTTVMITDTIGVKMRYPNFGLVDGKEKDDATLMVSCIDMIFEGDNITYVKDVPQDVLLKWYKDLEMNVKVKMYQTFMGTMPHLFHEETIPCPNCGTVHKLQFTELGDFFT